MRWSPQEKRPVAAEGPFAILCPRCTVHITTDTSRQSGNRVLAGTLPSPTPLWIPSSGQSAGSLRWCAPDDPSQRPATAGFRRVQTSHVPALIAAHSVVSTRPDTTKPLIERGRFLCRYGLFVERETGLEPATFCLEVRFVPLLPIADAPPPTPCMTEKARDIKELFRQLWYHTVIYHRRPSASDNHHGTHSVPITGGRYPRHGY